MASNHQGLNTHRFMKLFFFAIVCLVIMRPLHASSVEGTLCRIEMPAFSLNGVRIQSGRSNGNEDRSLMISYAEYRGTIGTVDVFVREGAVELLDPATPTAKVLALFERISGTAVQLRT
jgi:hypothetical protein